MIAGLILAGGGSRRMSADKATLLLAGKAMALHVADALRPQVAALALSGDAACHARLGLAMVEDAPEWRGAGPLAGLAAGLRWAAGVGADMLATAPCDAPFLPDDLVARLGAAGAPAMAHSLGRDHPTCALWSVALAATAEAALGRGERRLLHFAQSAGAARVMFPAEPGNDPFANVNSLADLASAEARLAGKATAEGH